MPHYAKHRQSSSRRVNVSLLNPPSVLTVAIVALSVVTFFALIILVVEALIMCLGP